MNELKELLYIVSKHRQKKIDMLSADALDQNKYARAANAIQEGKVLDDEEMASFVSMDKQSSQFRTFKLRLREKILNSLLFLDLDPRNVASYGRALSACSRNQHCIRILIYLSARQSAHLVAKSTLRKAEEFEFAEIALYCARMLRYHYSFLGNKKEFNYYNALQVYYAQMLDTESKSSEFLEFIHVSLVNSNVITLDDLAVIKSNLHSLKKMMGNCKSYKAGLNYYRIKAYLDSAVNNFHSALKTWLQFELLVDEYKHYEYDLRMGESSMQKMVCYLHLRDYANGEKCAEMCEMLFKKSSNNWLIYKEYVFLLEMHTKNYVKAGKNIREVTNDPHFKHWNVNRIEKWQILEAYYNLMNKAGKVKNNASNIRQAKYRVTKFLNSIPIHSKDKMGYNASILIIHAMYLLLDHNYGGLQNLMDNLKRYAAKYFPKGKKYRSMIFIKMLVSVDKCNYENRATKAATRKLYAKLKKSQYEYVSSLDGLEVVPFTDLWEIVLENLD